MSIIKQELIERSKYGLKCPHDMNPIGLCIHNTYNDASAENEASYMKGNDKATSFHVVVDDVEAIQCIPFNHNAWAAGDGSKGVGNRRFIHLEICYSKSGGPKFNIAENLAAKAAAEICKQFNWNISNIEPHRAFSGKDCPHRTSIDQFKRRVQEELKCSSETIVSFKNGEYDGRKAIVTTSTLNVRYDRGADNKEIAELHKDQIVDLGYCLNKWVAIQGYKGNKGFGYVHSGYLKLI